MIIGKRQNMLFYSIRVKKMLIFNDSDSLHSFLEELSHARSDDSTLSVPATRNAITVVEYCSSNV